MEQIKKESLAAEMFAIFYIQKKPLQLAFWFVFLCFVAYAVLAPSRYRAESSLLVKAKNLERSINNLDLTGIDATARINEEDVYTEAEILSSPEVLTKTATKILKKRLINAETSFDLFDDLFGEKAKNQQELIEKFSKKIKLALTVDVLAKTKIVHPVVLWKNPKDGETILNTLMWVYLEQRQDIQNSAESKEFLKNQVNVYLSDWKNKKSSIVKLVEKHNAPDPNLELKNNLELKKEYITAINQLEQQRDTLKSDTETLEKMLTDRENHFYAFLGLNNTVLSSLVQSLESVQKEKYEAEKIFLPTRIEVKSANEDLKNSIKTIRNEALLHLQQQKSILKTTEGTLISLADKLTKLEQRNIILKKVSVQIEELQMEASLMASSFDVFYKRRDESQFTGTLESNVAIISHAKSAVEVAQPKRVRVIFLGLFLAITLSLTVAFMLNAVDQTIKTPRDVESYLHAPVIFSIEDVGGRL